MTARKRLGHAILAMLGGAATYFFVIIAMDPWINLGWRRPIQDWMMAYGAGSLAGYFGLLYITIPDYTTAIIGGGVIGVVGWKRWWQLSLVYSGTMFAVPYLIMTLDKSVSLVNLNNRPWLLVALLLLNSAIIPLALAGAWLASKRRRRQNVCREFQLCLTCGYDLTGNESGFCPECGKPIERASRPVSSGK